MPLPPAESMHGRPRVVVLGASNVVRGIGDVVHAARSIAGPCELLIAMGHGRSYGMTTRILGRELSGLEQSHIWSALESPTDKRETFALLTDVGNDILYNADWTTIASWVETCLTRLARSGAKITMAGLPLARASLLSPKEFLFFRALLFPKSPLTFEKVMGEARALNQELQRLANLFDAHWIEPPRDWYAADPIHIQLRSKAIAWRKFFEELPTENHSSANLGASKKLRRASSWRLRFTPPHERKLWDVLQRTPQPAVRMKDGTTVAFY